MGSEKILTAPQEDLQWGHPANANISVVDAHTGVLSYGEPRRTKVALVGFAAGTKALAPYDDPTWEIWGLNQLYRHVPRADRWFDMHVNFDKENVEGTDHLGWLAKCPIPIYMVARHPEFPHSIRYPVEHMITKYGDYFTSTISFMLALAIEEGFQEIALYGIDLVVGTEYGYEKPCADFWMGIAIGKGIKITLPTGSALCAQTHRYGYQTEPNYGPLRIIEWDARLRHLQQQVTETKMKLANLDGALQEAEFWHNLYSLRMRGATINVLTPTK